jgi:hypothetical protein
VSLAAIALCAASLGSSLLWLRASTLTAVDLSDTGFVVGEPIGSSLAKDATETDATLFVFLRSDCTASRSVAESLPDLAQRMSALGVRTLAVVSASRGADERQFVETADLGSMEVRAVDFEVLPLRVVPAFVLVNTAGKVIRHEAGVVDPAEWDSLPEQLVPARF